MILSSDSSSRGSCRFWLRPPAASPPRSPDLHAAISPNVLVPVCDGCVLRLGTNSRTGGSRDGGGTSAVYFLLAWCYVWIIFYSKMACFLSLFSYNLSCKATINFLKVMKMCQNLQSISSQSFYASSNIYVDLCLIWESAVLIICLQGWTVLLHCLNLC